MAQGTEAKAPRGQRGIVHATVYAKHPDPYTYLAQRFVNAKKQETKDRLALELLPYERAKLKSIDITQTADVKVTIKIGGADADG